MTKRLKNTHKGFVAISKLLPEKIKEYKLEKAYYKYQAVKHWEAVAGGFIGGIKDSAKAMDLKNGVLVIACLSKELAYQIKLLAARILDEINRLIGRAVVFAIYVEV